VRGNESVGVGWVADNAYLHGLLGDLIESLSLSLEDLGIGSEQIGSLHSWSSWSGTDKHGDISVLESNHWVSGWHDVGNAVVSTVLKFHHESLKYLLGGWELDKLKNHLLVWSKHAPLTNEVAEEGTNLSSSTSHCDSNWSEFEVLWGLWEVAAELLKSAHE